MGVPAKVDAAAKNLVYVYRAILGLVCMHTNKRAPQWIIYFQPRRVGRIILVNDLLALGYHDVNTREAPTPHS
jgi:hypothetical protein